MSSSNFQCFKNENFLKNQGLFLGLKKCTFKKGVKMKDSIVRLISEGVNIKIKALDGTRTIYGATDVFGKISKYFEELNQPGLATGEIVASVYEMIKDANFEEIFTGIAANLDGMVMSQAQVIEFCREHRNWLCRNKASLFLIKKGVRRFVVYVNVNSDGLLSASFDYFIDEDRWCGENCHRIIVPKIILAA